MMRRRSFYVSFLDLGFLVVFVSLGFVWFIVCICGRFWGFLIFGGIQVLFLRFLHHLDFVHFSFRPPLEFLISNTYKNDLHLLLGLPLHVPVDINRLKSKNIWSLIKGKGVWIVCSWTFEYWTYLFKYYSVCNAL